jgi:glycosyltransferase involved in cell wall biosynthesis
MRAGIAHASVVPRDAIGHDVLGMYDILVESGFSVDLIGEYFESSIPSSCRKLTVEEAIEENDLDLLIYHHSIFWKKGETLLRSIRARRVMKYHNITPAEFFQGYSDFYEGQCRDGRDQTRRLIELFDAGDAFMADSAYNAAELLENGAAAVSVVPPFTMVADFAAAEPLTPEPPYTALFVGRLSPNKGHFDLLHVIAAYVAQFDREIRLMMVGGFDDNLDGYRFQVLDWIEKLGISDVVEMRDKVEATTLRELFRTSSAFLCMSEHEGFCVPIIEAQASGLPVVSVGSTALRDTIGSGQIVVDAPQSAADYLYIARLLRAACTNPQLRRQVIAAGYRNLVSRFTPPAVADRFVGALAPVLAGLA